MQVIGVMTNAIICEHKVHLICQELMRSFHLQLRNQAGNLDWCKLCHDSATKHNCSAVDQYFDYVIMYILPISLYSYLARVGSDCMNEGNLNSGALEMKKLTRRRWLQKVPSLEDIDIHLLLPYIARAPVYVVPKGLIPL